MKRHRRAVQVADDGNGERWRQPAAAEPARDVDRLHSNASISAHVSKLAGSRQLPFGL